MKNPRMTRDEFVNHMIAMCFGVMLLALILTITTLNYRLQLAHEQLRDVVRQRNELQEEIRNKK